MTTVYDYRPLYTHTFATRINNNILRSLHVYFTLLLEWNLSVWAWCVYRCMYECVCLFVHSIRCQNTHFLFYYLFPLTHLIETLFLWWVLGDWWIWVFWWIFLYMCRLKAKWIQQKYFFHHNQTKNTFKYRKT